MIRKKKKRVFPLSEYFVSRSKASKLHELRIAEDLGGVKFRKPASRKWADGAKGNFADVENERYMVDGKQTDRKQFTLSEKVIRKIDSEAASYGKIPVLAIEFLQMRFGIQHRWAVLPYDEFIRLVKGAQDGNRV